MKKLLLTVTLSLACVGAFAQGKVNFINDSLHLVYWDSSNPAYGSYAGQAYTLGQGGATLTIELWAGTSSSALSLQFTTDFTGQSAVGRWVGRTLAMPTAPAGMNFFDIQIFDVSGVTYSNAYNAGLIVGDSGVFSSIASGGTPYYSLVQHTTPASSTWADGTWNMDNLSPGYRGAIMLHQVPEPTTFALAGLAGAALMIFRRRR